MRFRYTIVYTFAWKKYLEAISPKVAGFKMTDLSKPLLSSEPAYKALKDYHDKNAASINMREMFKADPDRFKKFRQVYLKKFRRGIRSPIMSRSLMSAAGVRGNARIFSEIC